jgi:ubiquinone biosynthesis protein UbiJ
VAFSFALNRLLRAQPWALERLAPFAGETVEVRAGPLPALRLRIALGGTVEAADGEATLRMRIKPELVTALARGEEQALHAVEVEGNARLAAEIMVLARHLRWEVEEDLARVLGDVAAHRLASAGRALAAWHLDALERLAGAIGDYLVDEKRVLARRAELDALGESVARLRDGIARLDKRLERLG